MTAILTVAALWDLFYARIPNVLVLTGHLSAFCIVLIRDKGQVSECFLGMLLPCLAGFVFFAIGNLGAGDVKLLSVVGAFLGVKETMHCIGGAIAVGALIGGLKIITETERQRKIPHRVTIRFALPILCATMIRLYQMMK